MAAAGIKIRYWRFITSRQKFHILLKFISAIFYTHGLQVVLYIIKPERSTVVLGLASCTTILYPGLPAQYGKVNLYDNALPLTIFWSFVQDVSAGGWIFISWNIKIARDLFAFRRLVDLIAMWSFPDFGSLTDIAFDESRVVTRTSRNDLNETSRTASVLQLSYYVGYHHLLMFTESESCLLLG